MAKLRIYTDENVDFRVAEGLKKRGIEAFSAKEKGMIGVTDLEHFNYAFQMRAAIFTHDSHFIDIAKKLVEEGKNHWGVIFVSINKLSVGECIKRLADCTNNIVNRFLMLKNLITSYTKLSLLLCNWK